MVVAAQGQIDAMEVHGCGGASSWLRHRLPELNVPGDPTNKQRGITLMRHRLTRMVTTTAMLGASLAITGGVLLATSGPASARTGNPCTTFVGTYDASGPTGNPAISARLVLPLPLSLQPT